MEKRNDKDDEVAAEIIREFERLSGNRRVIESHWSEIADRCMPASSGRFLSPDRTPGAKRNQEVYDATAVLALSRFAAILDSLLTPRNQTWHKLKADNEYLNKDRDVGLYFDEVARTLFKFRYAPKANFSGQNQKNYRSLGAFGTGSMFIDKLAGRGERGLRYRATSLAGTYIDENHQGIVDKVLRHFKMTARQAVQMFAKEKLPDVIMQALETNPDKEFTFLHCVKPRTDYDPERVDYKGMHYGAYYVSIEGKKLLDEQGFNVFPYAVSRYEQEDDEVYGRSPAMDALPSVKTLNEEKKTVLKQGQRVVDPVLLASDDGIVDSFSLQSGAINAGGVSADGRALVHVLPTGNIAIGKDLMDDERKVINDFFLVNLFQILTENPQMTATEVMERTREKGILLAPTIGRQQSEYLGPMIEREIDLLSQLNLLPPMPDVLREAKGEFSIVYDSPLSRAQRAEEASGIMRVLEQGIAYFNATQDRSVFDFFEMDDIMPALAEIHGVPLKWIRSLDKVNKIRSSRAQDMQDQKMIQAAPAMAAGMKALPAMQEAMK